MKIHAAYKPIFRLYFILSIAGYVFIRLSRNDYYSIPAFLNNYLTDFLCMPVILTLSLTGVRLIKQIPLFVLTWPMIFGMTAFYAILFEFILPQYSAAYTGDIIDVLMYFAGAILYYLIWNYKPETKAIISK